MNFGYFIEKINKTILLTPSSVFTSFVHQPTKLEASVIVNMPKLCRGFGRHPLVRASNRLISYWNSTLALFLHAECWQQGSNSKYTWVRRKLSLISQHTLRSPIYSLLQFAKIVSKISTSFSFEKSFLIASSSCGACYTRICFKSTRFVLLYLAMSNAMAFGFFFDCVCHTSICKQRRKRGNCVKFSLQLDPIWKGLSLQK